MRFNNEKEFEFWESKIVLSVFVFLLVVLIVFAVNSFHKKYQIKKEISILDDEIKDLKELRDKMERQENVLMDKDYIEKEARIKLNFKKEGERVVVLVDNPKVSKEVDVVDSIVEQTDSKLSNIDNFKKWIDFIFK